MAMTKQADKDVALTQFQMEQAQIHACVMSPDHRTFFTWYRSGNIVQVVDGEAEQAGRAYDVAGFNAILEKHGMTGLQGRFALKSKCPETQAKT